MGQISFAEAEYTQKRHTTRREKFLVQMEQLIPWEILEKKIKPHYPKKGKGRQPYQLSTMLRIHCMQLSYNLSDPAMEDSLYEIESMRRFAGLRLSDRLPDETTILNFRHLLERHGLGEKLFHEINKHLKSQGLILREGSIVDASILSAPTSTKNNVRQRDPEMHQTKTGNSWHFGMKVHIGVDDALGLIHSIATTSANVHDITQADKLPHGKEECVWGDAGYRGIEKRKEHQHREVDCFIAMRPGTRRLLAKNSDTAKVEFRKAQIRAKVEHPFSYIKRVFGYDKVRYRGLAKNTNRLHVLAGFTNLMIAKKYLLT